MTVSLSIEVDNKKLAQAFQKAPKALQKNMKAAISTILSRIVRSAKIKAPKGHSQLTNSIHQKTKSALEGVVYSGANYASHVEHGTGIYGPLKKASGRFPPVRDIYEWIKVKGIQPNDPEMDQQSLAYLIVKSIAKKGTKPHPYMQPALDANKAKARKRIALAIDKTLQGMT